ncbi:MAG: DMT family transporter [Calothrix sp. SM1_5_4]|nr:DMT family transporter [Calothrix sp. SM1_5_4]
MSDKKVRAVFELLLASGFWGFGFIAAVWALARVNAFELTFLRFVLAALLLLPVAFINPESIRASLRMSFWPAVLLTGTLIFQTWGLQYTTATKSGFITTLYVVFVPLLESFIEKKRLPGAIWICVALSFVGTGFIVNAGFGTINVGDLLTLVCALLATGQIYWLGRVQSAGALSFRVQSRANALGGRTVRASGDRLRLGLQAGANRFVAADGLFWAFCFLTYGSTVLAFFLQVRAQAHLTPTVSSLLFLLESPFAMVFAILLLGEGLGPLETMGATLIFISAVMASLLEARGQKRASVKESLHSSALS